MTVKISEPFLTHAQEQAARAGYRDVGSYLEALIARIREDAAEWDGTVAAVREGHADFEAGRCRPARDVFTDLARKHGLTPPPDGLL
jgi:hypothetical protein